MKSSPDSLTSPRPLPRLPGSSSGLPSHRGHRARLRATLLTFTLGWALLGLATRGAQAAETGPWLWQIGQPDRQNAEFALAPSHYEDFKDDALFIVGQSNPKTDWPYAQPGPHDRWGGNRPHVFTIAFGLQQAPPSGSCRLRLELLDTQSQSPPKLQFSINGHPIEKSLPRGGGDDSIHGRLAQGKPHSLDVSFPADYLQTGDNVLHIKTATGSWILYDWLGLEVPAPAVLKSVATRTFLLGAELPAALAEKDGRLWQPLEVELRHLGGPTQATLKLDGKPVHAAKLASGRQTIHLDLPAVEQPTTMALTVSEGGEAQPIITQTVSLQPVPRRVIYVVPHSHTDIGYTDIQTAIETKQMENLRQGIAYARKTSGYPEGARFVWNVEVVWAADLYLNRMNDADRREFFEAVKKGWVSLNGMYLNELTGLCRPEELIRLFRFATQLSERTGVPIDTAMISDVPGYTWGTVTAMAQAGIRYFSTAPNYFDRIGDILVQWENKPFYWVSPSGREKVLVWIPYKGYAMSHIHPVMTPEFVAQYQQELAARNYPYDIAYMRWSGHGDNAVPDPAICEFIKDWNTKYRYPHFIISSASEAFRAFEQRYGRELPEAKGDWTPYWEDGAASSALETALNRASADRLTQAEALWAMRPPGAYPASAFEEAWKNVLLYSEHTWGAWCSVSDPENKITKEQWDIKQSYARTADVQSQQLLHQSLASSSPKSSTTSPAPTAFDVYNTTSWPRQELVIVPANQSSGRNRVLDDQNRPVPSQRLSNDDLAFLARDIPPFAARRFTLASGPAQVDGKVTTANGRLENEFLSLRVDPKTGGLIELKARGLDGDFVDAETGHGLNEYLFLPGDDLAQLQGAAPPKITVKENGPLVAVLAVESDAPGCRKLSRELRLVAGFDFVEIRNTVDKERAAISAKPGDWQFAQKGGKESIHFAFPFQVANGQLRLEVPFGVMQPEKDQIPGSCKNWYTVSRWADVSNDRQGITWVTLDAPLVEVGGITARLLGSQTNPEVWRKEVEPSRTIYSWAMNNHWGTNYRAYQDGPVDFRFVLRPHRQYAPDDASRFAIGQSQRLILVPVRGDAPPPSPTPAWQIKANGVLAITLKPSDDGNAWILRLFGASGKNETAKVLGPNGAPVNLWLSDTSEQPRKQIGSEVLVPGFDVVTLRATVKE